jgi:riboflavin synthase
MFTGLVQAIGSVQRAGSSLLITWPHGQTLSTPLQLGDSVAVDGVCLTVTRLLPAGFSADVSSETLLRSTLGAKADRGAPVNLEPALRLADRLGGHLVSGHVDGLGQVASIERQPGSWHLALRWSERRFGRYICDKASVAVNGISLTVAGAVEDGSHFWVAVIPHTWAHTTLQHLRVGEEVNLEADLLAKYAEQLLRQSGRGSASTADSPDAADLSDDWLRQHGWG